MFCRLSFLCFVRCPRMFLLVSKSLTVCSSFVKILNWDFAQVLYPGNEIHWGFTALLFSLCESKKPFVVLFCFRLSCNCSSHKTIWWPLPVSARSPDQIDGLQRSCHFWLRCSLFGCLFTRPVKCMRACGLSCVWTWYHHWQVHSLSGGFQSENRYLSSRHQIVILHILRVMYCPSPP